MNILSFKYFKQLFFSVLLIAGVFLANNVFAQEYNFKYKGVDSIVLDDVTAQKGYTIQMFDNQISFGITPGVLTEGGKFEFKEVELLDNSGMDIPEGYKLVSKILEFDVKNKKAYDPSKPFWLRMKFDSSLKFDKFLFYFDQGKGRWIELPSKTNLKEGYVQAAFHLPFAKLAVFDTEVMVKGKASWYAYKYCMCAASPDYPKGTELLVVNLNKNEAIVVTVNDWGPERDIFPDRVIDLDVVAFTKFATKGTGVLQNVAVYPYDSSIFSQTEQIVLESGGVLPLDKDKLDQVNQLAGDQNFTPEEATLTNP